MSRPEASPGREPSFRANKQERRLGDPVIPSRESKKKLPKGIRKHNRRKKAEVRRELPPESQFDTMRRRAQNRMKGLHGEIINYLTAHKKLFGPNDIAVLEMETPETETQDGEATRILGILLVKTLNADAAHPDVATPRQMAVGFVELTWIRHGLNLVTFEETTQHIRNFLDTCSPSLLDYLTGDEPRQKPSPLQQARNRVFNPINNKLDIRGY